MWRNFTLDRLSFWIGFLSGVLAGLILDRLLPSISQKQQKKRARLKETQTKLTVDSETHYRNDVLRQAQHLHFLAPLFSLDEILIEPRLLAPPVPLQPGQEKIATTIANSLIPYLPDWPELAATCHAPTLTLSQALSAGANLILIGHPGSGKTVALAHLATLVARKEAKAREMAKLTPLLLHAADLSLPLRENTPSLDILTEAVANHLTDFNKSQLPAFLRQIFEEKRALLLLDGVDELPPVYAQEVGKFLAVLLKDFPTVRVVVAASLESFAGLNKLGLVPIAMATWGMQQRVSFLQKWEDLWNDFVLSDAQSGVEPIDSSLLRGWLLSDNASFTPLEFTLKTWAAFAGDALGAGSGDAIEAYLRRMTGRPKDRPALENLALQMTTSQRTIIGRKEAQELAGDMDASTLESEIFVTQPAPKVRFSHPVIAAHLAARSLAQTDDGETLKGQLEWAGKTLGLQAWAALKDLSPLANQYLESQGDPLYRKPLMAASWLSHSVKNAGWRPAAMRFLATLLRQENLPIGLRGRVMVALANSGESGVNTLFHQLFRDRQPEVRKLAALGCGMLRDASAVADLTNLLNDASPLVSQAAIIALAAIGNKPALESLVSALLHGDEVLRRATAEALADNPAEGHPLLKEAAEMDDLLVRRAAVFGLAQVGEPWAIQILEKMSVEDGQWVVKSAALQASETAIRPDVHIPRPPRPLGDIPWLIAFAGERGMGVSSGKAALKLLYQALSEGSEEQQLAALEEFRLRGDERVIPLLHTMLKSGQETVREAAFNTLWHLAASGVELSPPT